MTSTDSLAVAAWILAPVAAIVLVRRFAEFSARWRWARRGLLVGTLAMPLSALLYSLFWLIPVVGAIVGIPGLILLMWHLLPFPGAFEELYGAVLGNGTATGAFSLLPPTVFWALAYGGVGTYLDVRRQRSLLSGNAV